MSTSKVASWHVVLPVKRRESSKTRLGAHEIARQALALAFASDTMRAVLACTHVGELVVVTEDATVAALASSLGATVVAESHVPDVRGFARLNQAIEQGISIRGLGDEPVAALTADLPALRPGELAAALELAAGHARAFVPDHTGTGTSMVTAMRGSQLHPAFGLSSAQAHLRSGAALLDIDAPGLRLDVDFPEDLHTALALGCGEATTALHSRVTPAPES